MRACSIVSPRDTGTPLLCSEIYRTSKPSSVLRMEVPEGRVEMLSYVIDSFEEDKDMFSPSSIPISYARFSSSLKHRSRISSCRYSGVGFAHVMDSCSDISSLSLSQ